MTDRELLEMAAKAAGIDVFWWPADDPVALRLKRNNDLWNPLTDDGDALRLAVKLMIYLNIDGMEIGYRTGHVLHVMTINIQDGDVLASIRRAIVRAAAAIGKAMA